MKKNKLALALIISGLCAAGTANAADDRYIIQVDNNKKGVVKALAKKLGGDIKVDGNGFIAAQFSGHDLASIKGLLNNPHNKEMAAAFCIFTNYNRMKERMAFQRLRANAADKYYRDFAGAEIRDREAMIQLSKVLLETNLNSQDASHNLENAITTVLEQSLTYL